MMQIGPNFFYRFLFDNIFGLDTLKQLNMSTDIVQHQKLTESCFFLTFFGQCLHDFHKRIILIHTKNLRMYTIDLK